MHSCRFPTTNDTTQLPDHVSPTDGHDRGDTIMAIPLEAFVPQAERQLITTLRESIDIPLATLAAVASKIKTRYSYNVLDDAHKEQVRLKVSSQPPLDLDFKLGKQEA